MLCVCSVVVWLYGNDLVAAPYSYSNGTLQLHNSSGSVMDQGLVVACMIYSTTTMARQVH